MKHPAILAALVLLLAGGPLAQAKEVAPPSERSVSRSRVMLSDVLANAPAEIAGLDLGPTPPPGSSRLIHRQDIASALIEAGHASKLQLPRVVRIVRKTQKLDVTEVERIATQALSAQKLPRGASLVAARPKSSLTIPAGHTEVRVRLPKPPRKAGKLTTVATLTFLEGAATLAEVSVPIELSLPPEAALPDFKKGARVQVFIRRGLIEVKATATLATDSDVDDVVNATLIDSGKVLRVKLVSTDPPAAEEAT